MSPPTRQDVAHERRHAFHQIGGQDVVVRFFPHTKRSLFPASSSELAYEADGERQMWAKSGRRDSNPRQPAWKAGTLPTELLPHGCWTITLG